MAAQALSTGGEEASLDPGGLQRLGPALEGLELPAEGELVLEGAEPDPHSAPMIHNATGQMS